jgi:diaminopimelate epimerase
MVVRERGAGWTQACGTGSVAVAWAAHQQGWVGDVVTVHNPGGTVQVELVGLEAMLIGPAVFVAAVDVPQAQAGGRP